jgi:hypothetical protein
MSPKYRGITVSSLEQEAIDGFVFIQVSRTKSMPETIGNPSNRLQLLLLIGSA